MEFSGQSILAAGVGLFAAVAAPLLYRALVEVTSQASETGRAIASAAVVLGGLGMGGLVWAPMAGQSGWLVLIFSLLLLKAGLGLIVVFTWRMFRTGARIAPFLTLALLCGLGVSLGLDVATVRTNATYPPESAGFRFGQVMTSLPFLWLGLECLLRRRKQRTPMGAGSAPHDWLGRERLVPWSVACLLLFVECHVALAISLSSSAWLREWLLAAQGAMYAAVAGCVFFAFYLPALRPTATRS